MQSSSELKKTAILFLILTFFLSCNSNNEELTPYPVIDPDVGPSVSIPDHNFEASLIAQRIDTDGELNHQIWEQDALAAIEMNLFFTGSDNEDKITDLTGIEAFKNVEHLIVGDHALQTVSLAENTALKKLYLSFNQITEIDLSKNTSLTHLFIGRNDLTTLDLSHNTELQYLHAEANQLTSLDLSHNPDLIEVLVTANLLSSVTGFENTSQLTKLYLGFNDLQEFSIHQPSLEGLNIENNLLTVLNVDNCSNLEYLLARQ
ncbi:leucine-rich repeat domain-containing protein [Roseivirga sp.]|uniref:leucine-rich repeat domain-containing protein n=1 Tax=Roseivirga sp. TaxID=1964215 RepID=UPI002B265AA4|nr:leucine-rich repeat domain-containing protein [Roseivirga sp.]